MIDPDRLLQSLSLQELYLLKNSLEKQIASRQQTFLSVAVSSLKMSRRLHLMLLRLAINDLAQMQRYSGKEIKAIKGFGKETFAELHRLMESNGVNFKEK